MPDYPAGEGPVTQDEAKERAKHIAKHDPKPEKVDYDLDKHQEEER